MAKPISQSDTRWVKKSGKRGYVEQISTGKRVTGKVNLVADTTKGKAGQTRTYSKGRDVTGSAKTVAYRAPVTSDGSPKTSGAGPVSETRTLPGGMSSQQAAKFVAFKAGTEGRRSGVSTPKPPASISGSNSQTGPGPRAKSAKMRKRQAVKTRSARAQRSRAQSRQSGVRTAVGLSNPITAPATLSAILAPKYFRAVGSVRRSAKNWWEGK